MANAARSRLTVEARREQLLAVGAEIFGSRPFEEVSIEEIADRAGVSRGLLYHYFATKRDFLAAVVQAQVQSFSEMAVVDETLAPMERFAASVDGYLEWAEQHADGYRALHSGAEGVDERIRAIVRASQAAQEQRILESLGAVGDPRMTLAVHGWIAFSIAVCLDWLTQRQLSRDAVRDLIVTTLLDLASKSHPAARAQQ